MFTKMLCALLSVLIVLGTIQPARAYSQTKYKAKGQINPAQVRTVVTRIGIGKMVKIKLDSNVTFNGRITEIGSNTVTIRKDKTAELNVVVFDQIKELQPRSMRTLYKVIIIGGSIYLGLALLFSQVIGPNL